MEKRIKKKVVDDDRSMGGLAILFMYAIVIGAVSVIAYFVIKKAVKDALKEYNNEKHS